MTRVIELPDTTRRDNMFTFPEFTDLADVPHHGLSVGIGTIVDNTRQAVMMLTGADKQTAFERIAAAEPLRTGLACDRRHRVRGVHDPCRRRRLPRLSDQPRSL